MTQRLGRPRDEKLDEAILDAIVELLLAHGYSRVTVSALVKRAGTTKSAFYRRYTDLADAVGAMLRRRFGVNADIDTGNFVDDLRLVQQRQAELFRDPLVHRGLVGFLEVTQHDADRAQAFLREFLYPRRAGVRTMLERAHARGEIPDPVDSEWICDLITGPLLIRALLPGLPPIDDELLDNTVEVTLQAVRHRRSPDGRAIRR